MDRLLNFVARLLGDVGTVFYLSMFIIAGFVVTAVAIPEVIEQTAQQILDATATNVGWMYLLVTSGFVVFTLSLALSKYGSTRLAESSGLPASSAVRCLWCDGDAVDPTTRSIRHGELCVEAR